MTEVEKLKQRLEEMNSNIKIFPGSDANVSNERLAAEINKSLDELESGDWEDVTDIDD